MLDGVHTVLSLLLDWILTPEPIASKSSGHYYRGYHCISAISIVLGLEESTRDISPAVLSGQVSEYAILHSTNLYKLPSTSQLHSESFTSLPCALSPVKK